LRQLTNLIGKFGGNDLLAALDFTPKELGDAEESIHLDFIKAEGKYITGKSDTKADIYLVKFTIDQLLRIARVSRYDGIPFILDGGVTGENYQRLLIDKKLSDISQNFIADNKRQTFPNTITLALSNECKEEVIDGKNKLTIPKKFSSIDIIDGQHRLYGYTQADVNDGVRQHAEILASAIKFKTDDQQVIGKSAAKVFCEINSTQAIVKKELLYLIKYDVLGDIDHIALAGKVLLECDSRGGGALAGIFLISSLRRRNKLNLPCVPITNIIDYELAPFLNGIGVDGYIADNNDFKRVFNYDKEFLNLNAEIFYKSVVYVLELYFKHVKNTFVFDWKNNADTHLITESYFCALIRLLRLELYNNKKTPDELLSVLEVLKEQVDLIVMPNKSPSFPTTNISLPDSAGEADKIFSFIMTSLNSKV
jgi:hypothetical protein